MKVIQIAMLETVHWEGPGVYVGRRNRGPATLVKVPEGKTVIDNGSNIIKEFAQEPAPYQAPPVNNGLWK